MSGRKVVTCRSERGGQVERPIRVDEIAPDLSLSRLAWLEPSALQLLEELGKGGFGVVFKAQLGARLVAVKKLRSVASLDNAADAQEAFSAMQEFQLEATLMQSLHHRNLVRFFGVTPPPDIAMVMEYVPFGDLGRLLEAREPALDMQRFRLRVALDIARGMRYLHSMHVIHRDLKTSNVFICALDPDAPVVAKASFYRISVLYLLSLSLSLDAPLWQQLTRAQVADFGLSQVCVDDASAGLLENWLYTAPETWERKTYTTKALPFLSPSHVSRRVCTERRRRTCGRSGWCCTSLRCGSRHGPKR
jgi:serine/threonine protein kinase